MGDGTDGELSNHGWSECEKGVSAEAAGRRFSAKAA
jgi:hypothetical protein